MPKRMVRPPKSRTRKAPKATLPKAVAAQAQIRELEAKYAKYGEIVKKAIAATSNKKFGTPEYEAANKKYWKASSIRNAVGKQLEAAKGKLAIAKGKPIEARIGYYSGNAASGVPGMASDNVDMLWMGIEIPALGVEVTDDGSSKSAMLRDARKALVAVQRSTAQRYRVEKNETVYVESKDTTREHASHELMSKAQLISEIKSGINEWKDRYD